MDLAISISSAHDARRARAHAAWLGRPPVRSVHVSLAGLDFATRERVARRLRRLFNDCGCLWGAPAFLATLALLLMRSWPAGLHWRSTLAAFAVAVTASVMAKLAGLAWSRWRLVRLLSSLEALAARSPSASAHTDAIAPPRAKTSIPRPLEPELSR